VLLCWLIRCFHAVELSFLLDKQLLVRSRQLFEQSRQVGSEFVEPYSSSLFRHDVSMIAEPAA
jgi:hypothetical protein